MVPGTRAPRSSETDLCFSTWLGRVLQITDAKQRCSAILIIILLYNYTYGIYENSDVTFVQSNLVNKLQLHI